MDENTAARLDKENLGHALVIISWVFATIALIVVVVRAYVRLNIVKRFQIDDWLIIFTYVLALCDSIFCTISVRWGLGHHIQFLTPDQIQNSIKYVFICEAFTIMSPCFGRISYAILLLQLVPPTKWPKRFLWTVIWTQFVVDVGTVIVSFSQCQPINAFWGPNAKQYCWDPRVQQYTGFFQGSVCSVVDLILALFPASLFWKLNMKLSTKISLSILMGLGVFAMVCSIIKTIQLQAINEKGDPTYAMAKLAIWFTLEAYMVLLAASIPTLRPLMRTTGASSRPVKGWSSSFALRDLHPNSGGTIGSHGPRRKGGDQFYILSDDSPVSSKDKRLNISVGVGQGTTDGAAEDIDGISKTTTVTVLHDGMV